MKNAVVAVVVLMLLGVSVAMAACPMHDMGDPEAEAYMMDHEYTIAEGPMMRMAGAMDMASHGGYTYLLVGGTIEKRDAEGEVVATAELPRLAEEARHMRQQGVCPVCGGTHEPEADQAGAYGSRGGEGDRDRQMRAARQRQMSRVYGRTAIQADEDGVRVLRAGRMYVFNHDLEQQAVVQVVDPGGPGWANLCECVVAETGDGDCPVCAIRDRWRGEPIEAALDEGVVALYTRPMTRRAGITRFGVHVLDIDRDLDPDAQINAFVYPKGNPDAGMDVDITRLGAGRFYGESHLDKPGAYELAVRVIRPGVEDERVYFEVNIDTPTQIAMDFDDVPEIEGTVRVTLVDGEIQMPETLPAGPTVFVVVNQGTLPHSIQLERNTTEITLGRTLAAGESAALEATLETGTYEVICPVGDHAEQGMRMTLTVTE